MTMAATFSAPTTPTTGVDEILLQNDTVSLCLLVNRRHRTLRVVDFRAGATVAKRNFVIAAAKREGVEKVFTLVERDEVATWTRLGFTREGSIPGFYKRSDAWILGAVVSQVRPMQGEPVVVDDDDDDDLAVEEPTSPAAALAERTIAKARRLVKASPEKPLPVIKMAPARESDVKKAVATALRQNRAITGFEPFGRDATRTNHVLTGRGGFELYASWEQQACFGNSYLEILTGPRDENERFATIAAVRVLCDRLIEQGAVSTFTFAPADDVGLASVFMSAGFRRSAVLARHIIVAGERKDAILWSRKLLTPEG